MSAQDIPVLDELIVTATKRPREIQDVPLSVTAMTEEAIEDAGMVTLQKLGELHPSVKFDQAHSFQNASLKIRGIGTIGVSRTFEGSVGVFVDDVYRSRSGMALFDLLDIAQLEVMRGPQGTLFGKNTAAGAIALHSNLPELDDLSGELDARIGNLEERHVSGNVNIPLPGEMALRLAGLYHERDGAFRSPDSGDQYDAIDRHAFKAHWALFPRDNLELRVIADYANSDAECCWASAQSVNGDWASLIADYGSLHGLTFVRAPAAEAERLESLNTLPAETITDDGVVATVDWRLPGDIALKSITSIRNWEHEHVDADPDYSPADLFILNEPASIDTFSQELNLTLSAGRADMLLGFYYGDEEYRGWRSAATGQDADNYLNALISAQLGAPACTPPFSTQDCVFPQGIGALLPTGEFTRENYAQDGRTYALFAHGTIPLRDSFSVDVGLRYNVEDKDGSVANVFWYDSAIARAAFTAFYGVPDDGTPRNGFDLVGTMYSPSFDESTRDEEWTGEVALQYQAQSGPVYYVTYQRGYKAGGVNLYREAVLTNTTAYAPEFADSLELGIKAEYLDGRARTNVALFSTDFSDLQINFFDGLNFRTENTGEARTQGLEIENQWQLTDGIRLEVAATYLDSKFETINTPNLDYLLGRDTPRAPRWAAVAQIAYEKPIGGDRILLVRGLTSYTGDHYVGADVRTEQKVSAYTIVDSSIGIRFETLGFDALLWCSNCRDESYRTIYFNSTFQPGSFNSFLNPPRQYGVTLRKSF